MTLAARTRLWILVAVAAAILAAAARNDSWRSAAGHEAVVAAVQPQASAVLDAAATAYDAEVPSQEARAPQRAPVVADRPPIDTAAATTPQTSTPAPPPQRSFHLAGLWFFGIIVAFRLLSS